MPQSKRLEELQRQRAALQEQLSSLDREIAAAGQRAAEITASGGPPAGFVAAPAPVPAPDAADTDPDLILRQFAAEPDRPAVAKRGCVIAFAAGMIALAGALFAIYLSYYR